MHHSAIGIGDTTFWGSSKSPTAGHNNRQWIDLGTLRLPRERVAGCRLEDIVDHDRAGRFATLALLLAASLVLALGLIDLDWRMRMLLATAVLTIVTIASAIEVLGIGRTVHYRLVVVLVDGRRVSFTTDSRREAERLADDLGPMPPPALDALD